MAKKAKPKKKQRPYRSLYVRTNGVDGDTCPKRGGKPLRLGDGQCCGEKKCRRYLGLGWLVTIRCAYQ